MKIMVNNELRELNYFIGNSPENSAWDVIRNAGAANQFKYDNDREFYVTDQKTFDWWKNYFSHQEVLEKRIAEISISLNDSDKAKFMGKIVESLDVDYDTHYSNCSSVCDEWELKSNEIDNQLTMRILDGNMGDGWNDNKEAAKGYAEWLLKEKGIESEILLNSSGVGGGLYDDNGNLIENDLSNKLFNEFCESEAAKNYFKNEITKSKTMGMDF